MKLTPEQKIEAEKSYEAAKLAHAEAMRNCVHWQDDGTHSDPGALCDCCRAVMDADDNVRKAKIWLTKGIRFS